MMSGFLSEGATQLQRLLAAEEGYLLTLIRVYGRMPLAWSRSWATEGFRLLHLLCPMGQALCAAAAGRRVQLPPYEDHAHGFTPFRSREGAIIVTTCVFRIQGGSHVMCILKRLTLF